MAKTKRKSKYGKYPGPNSFERCYSVGELKKALANVPDELPLNGDDGVMPVWFNVGYEGAGVNQEHLNFEKDPDMDDF